MPRLMPRKKGAVGAVKKALSPPFFPLHSNQFTLYGADFLAVTVNSPSLKGKQTMRSKIHAIPRQRASAPAGYVLPNYEGNRGPAETPEILTGQQAARFLGVCYPTFRKILKAWNIPHRKIGRRVMISKTAIIQTINNGLTAGGAESEKGERG